MYLVPWQPWPDCCTPSASFGEDGLLRRATGLPYCVPILHRAPNPAGHAGSNPEKKFSVWEGGSVHLQPVFGRSCRFQERGRDESPLGLWGKDVFWMRTRWFDASC